MAYWPPEGINIGKPVRREKREFTPRELPATPAPIRRDVPAPSTPAPIRRDVPTPAPVKTPQRVKEPIEEAVGDTWRVGQMNGPRHLENDKNSPEAGTYHRNTEHGRYKIQPENGKARLNFTPHDHMTNHLDAGTHLAQDTKGAMKQAGDWEEAFHNHFNPQHKEIKDVLAKIRVRNKDGYENL